MRSTEVQSSHILYTNSRWFQTSKLNFVKAWNWIKVEGNPVDASSGWLSLMVLAPLWDWWSSCAWCPAKCPSVSLDLGSCWIAQCGEHIPHWYTYVDKFPQNTTLCLHNYHPLSYLVLTVTDVYIDMLLWRGRSGPSVFTLAIGGISVSSSRYAFGWWKRSGSTTDFSDSPTSPLVKRH